MRPIPGRIVVPGQGTFQKLGGRKETAVFITLQQLERNPVRFSLDLEPGEVELDSALTQTSPLHAEGTASLLNHALGEIRIAGKLRVQISSTCDRCLESVSLPVESPFDLVYLPADESGGGEKEVDEDAIEVGFYEGSGIELKDVLREVVLLALPMQVVCREGCKGICPVCGENRNNRTCDCHLSTADERWNKLKNFRPQSA